MKTDLEKLARSIDKETADFRLRTLIREIIDQFGAHAPSEKRFVYEDEEGRTFQITVEKANTT